MFGKGKSDFQAYVEATQQAITNMLTFFPQKLEELRNEIERECEKIIEEHQVWNEKTQDVDYTRSHPIADTSFIDEMKDLFYTAMVNRIYSFAEDGLIKLSGCTQKPKASKGQRQLSDVDLYFQKIADAHPNMPTIDTLWPQKISFHRLRNDVVHHGKKQLEPFEIKMLSDNTNQIALLLTTIENIIRGNK